MRWTRGDDSLLHPVVIFNRGGGKEFGALSRGCIAEWLSHVAGWGYVVVASQYRGNGGSEGKDEFGGRDVPGPAALAPARAARPVSTAGAAGYRTEADGGWVIVRLD